MATNNLTETNESEGANVPSPPISIATLREAVSVLNGNNTENLREIFIVDSFGSLSRRVFPSTGTINFLHTPSSVDINELTPTNKEDKMALEKAKSRSYASRTLSDIKRLSLSFMKRDRDDEQIAEVQEQVDYLTMMAHTVPQIRHLKYLKHFCENGDRMKPILDKSELNKIIFEYMKSNSDTNIFKPDKQKELISVDECMKTFLETRKKTLEDDIKYYENDSEAHKRNIESYQKSIDTYLKRIVECNEYVDKYLDELDKLETVGEAEPPFIEEFNKIVEDGNWILYSSDNEDLIYKFYSANSIVCSHYNPAAGIDMSLDFGHFYWKIDIKNKSQTVGIFFANREYKHNGSTTLHPHISSYLDGTICWGNKSDQVIEAFTDHRFLEISKILLELLTCYSPSNPYITLDTLKRKRKEIDPSDLLSRITTEFRSAPDWVKESFVDLEEYKEITAFKYGIMKKFRIKDTYGRASRVGKIVYSRCNDFSSVADLTVRVRLIGYAPFVISIEHLEEVPMDTPLSTDAYTGSDIIKLIGNVVKSKDSGSKYFVNRYDSGYREFEAIKLTDGEGNWLKPEEISLSTTYFTKDQIELLEGEYYGA